MTICYKRLLKETETICTSKTGKKKNKLDSHYDDSLPTPNELIARIDNHLKHLQGQKKILQNAKDGKTWRNTFSLSEKTDNKNLRPSMGKCSSRCCGQLSDVLQEIFKNKSVNVTNSYTQIGSSLNNLNTKRKYRESPSRDFSTCTNVSSHFGQNVNLPSDKSLFNNAEMKICKYSPSTKKISSKTHASVPEKYSKRFSNQKHKIFSSEINSSKSPKITPKLENKACETIEMKKDEGRSHPPYEPHTFKNINNNHLRKTVKTKSNCTQTSKNFSEFMFAPQSSKNDKQPKYILRHPKGSGRNLERTESSIRRHAKLSKEILDYEQRRRERMETYENKTNKEIFSEVNNRSLHSQNKELSKKRTNSHDKKEYRKHDADMNRSKNNNLTKTPRSSNSYNFNTIMPKIIDDRTYVCPDNSEKNNYSLLPYVGNTSEDNVYFNVSPKLERAHLDTQHSLFEETTSKSVVLLEDISSQQSSMPSRSIGNERKSKHSDYYHELVSKDGVSKNSVNQKIRREKSLIHSSDKSEYGSHDLESTWKSHVNREGYNNHNKILKNYRSHCSYDLKDHSIQSNSKRFSHQRKHEIKPLYSSINSNFVNSKSISKPSEQHYPIEQFHDHYPTKLTPQMEKAEMLMPSENLWQNRSISRTSSSSESNILTIENRKSISEDNQIDNKTFTIELDKLSLKDNSSSIISCPNEKLGNFLELKLLCQSSFELGNTNGFGVKTSIVEHKTLPAQLLTAQVPVLGANSKSHFLMNPHIETPKLNVPQTVEVKIKDNMETIASSKASSSIVSWTPRNKLTLSDSKVQEQLIKQRFIDSINHNDLVSKSFCHKSGTVLKMITGTLPAKEKLLLLKTSHVSHKNDTQLRKSIDGTDLAHQTEEYETHDVFQKPLRSEARLKAPTEDISLKFEFELTPQKNTSQDSQSITSKSELHYTLNDYELSAISKLSFKENESKRKTNSFSSIDPPKTNDVFRKISQTQKISGSTEDSPITYPTQQTSNNITLRDNQTFYLKSGPYQDAEVGVLTSILSGSKFVSTLKISSKSNHQSSFSISSFSLPAPSKAYESKDISQNIPRRSEPKLCASSGRISLEFEPEQSEKDTPQIHQSDEQKPESNHFADKEVLKPLTPALNDSELGAIPKLSANDKNLAFKSIANKSLLSGRISLQFEPEQPLAEDSHKFHKSEEKNKPESKHFADVDFLKENQSTLNDSVLSAIPKLSANEKNLADLPKIFKTPNLSQKSPHDNNQFNNSAAKMSSKSATKVSTSRRLRSDKIKENDKCSISNDESPTTFKKILSQQSLPTTNRSSASQYLDLFWNDKDAVKNIFRKSPSKLKQNSNFLRSSQSSQDLNNKNESVEILKGTTSLVILNLDKLEEEKFNLMTPRTSIMPSIFPRLKEELSSVSHHLSLKLSNNQTEKNFEQNSSLSLYNSSLNETKESVNNEQRVFLSDTFNQNIPSENISREASDLIQHLQNRVRDCDEKVKKQSKEFEKLKKNCKTFEPLTSTDCNKKEDEEKKPKDLKEVASKKVLENIGTNEQMEPLIRNVTSESDITEENSCLCIFCGEKNSTSDYSEEIPSFTGCECMKEDYYKIMRIAYNK